MRIVIGTGNAVTCVFSASAKTLTFSGAYNFDINLSGLTVYNATRSAYMWGDPSIPAVTGTGPVFTRVAGLLVQTITLSAVSASAADGDSLVVMTDCPDDVAIYNATVTT